MTSTKYFFSYLVFFIASFFFSLYFMPSVSDILHGLDPYFSLRVFLISFCYLAMIYFTYLRGRTIQRTFVFIFPLLAYLFHLSVIFYFIAFCVGFVCLLVCSFLK
jgi:hypothetical protein